MHVEPDAGTGPDRADLEAEIRRTREIEIDVLIGHELATGSPAAERIWKAAELEPPGFTTPSYQWPFHVLASDRTADVRVAVEGVELFVEDKAIGGQFTTGQPEAYDRLPFETHRTVLVAPRSFLNAHTDEATCFTGTVALEDLAAALEDAIPGLPCSELKRSYEHRAKEFRRCLKDPGPSPINAQVASFSEAYRALAEQRTGGIVKLSPQTMMRTQQSEIDFVRWSTDGNPLFRPYHKLTQGFIDFRVPGYELAELCQLLSAHPLPEGWEPVKQETGRHPVLRFEVEKWDGDLDFDRFRSIAERALDALAELRRWWNGGGEMLLCGSSDAALAWLIQRASEVAHRRGLHSEAANLEGILASLDGAIPAQPSTSPEP